MIPVFYSNKPDDNHCLQASLLIVLNSLGYSVSWKEINRLTSYDSRYYSWTITAASIISQYIPKAKFMTRIDYRKFADQGEQYLKQIWDENWFNTQQSHASPGFIREQNFAKNFKGNYVLLSKKPTVKKLTSLLKGNFLIALINPYIIRGEDGAAGHFVVVYSKFKNNFVYHDPGNPPIKGARSECEIFLKAMSDEFLVVPNNTV